MSNYYNGVHFNEQNLEYIHYTIGPFFFIIILFILDLIFFNSSEANFMVFLIFLSAQTHTDSWS